MAKMPDPIDSTVTRIYAAYEKKNAQQTRRGYLGVSSLGHACERYLWLSFRQCVTPKFDGRVLRLFDTGNWEEKRIVADLRAVGCDVHEVDPSNGRQFGFVAVDGHLRGHMDAAVSGLMESPSTWHVAEFKTHNEKSYADLVKQGVEKSKPMHYVQMNTYCGLSGMESMVYIAVNKNTDDIYIERLPFDPKRFAKDMERAARIVYSEEAPLRLSENPSWYECKWCEAYEQCHGTAAPDTSCRSCAHSTPVADGKWTCEAKGIECGEPCDQHLHRPELLSKFAEFKGSDGKKVLYLNKLTNKEFANGVGSYLSREITAAADKKILGESDANFDYFRSLGGEIIG